MSEGKRKHTRHISENVDMGRVLFRGTQNESQVVSLSTHRFSLLDVLRNKGDY